MAFFFPLEEMILVSVKPGGLNRSTLDIGAGQVYILRDCLVHCRMFNSICVLYLLEANTPTPQSWQLWISPGITKYLRGKTTFMWYPLS